MMYKFMKVGFSLGRCIRDIVTGKVDIDMVVVIVCRTRILTKVMLKDVLEDYAFDDNYLKGLDVDECMRVAEILWDSGRLHQPGLKGSFVRKVPEKYVWLSLIPDTYEDDPVVAYSLGKYLMALRLIDSLDQPELIVRY